MNNQPGALKVNLKSSLGVMKIKTLGKFPGGDPNLTRSSLVAWCRAPRWFKPFQVLAFLGAGLFFAGCEIDAAERGDSSSQHAASTGSTNAPISLEIPQSDGTNQSEAFSTNQVEDVSTNISTSTNAVAIGSTNTPGSTNIVANQDITILNEIPPAQPADINLSWSTEQVVKLVQSGLSDSVLLSYVQKSTNSFNLDAEDILYLHDIGVGEEVIAAMLNHDGADPALAAAPKKEPEVQAQTPPTDGPQPQMTDLGAAAGAQPEAVQVMTNYVPNVPNGAVVGNVPVQTEVQPEPQQQVVVQQQPVIIQQQPQVIVTAPEPAVTYSTFYSSLSPYGSWLYVADYGWCWQPTVAVAHTGWRPYLHNGRWIYSNHGWYWHSDYSWGWAPFHYGRWYHPPGRGWVWVPDHTWGPSWVTWRMGRDYCGWAPLPPRARYVHGVGFSYHDRHVSSGFSFGLSYHHYSFVPTRRFADRRLHRHAVPPQQTVNIYKDSTVVNNYVQGNNNTIVNAGISKNHIENVTRTEIQKVNVRETPANPRLVQPDRIRREGNDLVVYRPTSIDRGGAPGAATTGVASRMAQEPNRGNPSPGASRMERWNARQSAGAGAGAAGRGELPSQSRAISPRAAASLGSQPTPATAASPAVRGNINGSSTPAPAQGATSALSSRAGQELQRGSTTPGASPQERQSIPMRRGNVPVVQGQAASRSTAGDILGPQVAASGNTAQSSTQPSSGTRAIQSTSPTAIQNGPGSGLVSTSPTGRPAPVTPSVGAVSSGGRSVEPSRGDAVQRQSSGTTPIASQSRMERWSGTPTQPARGASTPSVGQPPSRSQLSVPSVTSRSPEPARSGSFAAPAANNNNLSRMELWQRQQAASPQPSASYRTPEPARSPGLVTPTAPAASASNPGMTRMEMWQRQQAAAPAYNARSVEPSRGTLPAPAYNRPAPAYSAPSVSTPAARSVPSGQSRMEMWQGQRNSMPAPSYRAPSVSQSVPPSAPAQVQSLPPRSMSPTYNGGGSRPSPAPSAPSGGGVTPGRSREEMWRR